MYQQIFIPRSIAKPSGSSLSGCRSAIISGTRQGIQTFSGSRDQRRSAILLALLATIFGPLFSRATHWMMVAMIPFSALLIAEKFGSVPAFLLLSLMIVLHLLFVRLVPFETKDLHLNRLDTGWYFSNNGFSTFNKIR